MDGIPFDSTGNPKQVSFFCTAVLAAGGNVPQRQLLYGGAIRGGKTFVSLAALSYLLGAEYAGARAHVVRQSEPALWNTTIASFKKFGVAGKWIRKAGQVHFTFSNGSQLHFMSENIAADPDLDRFKGLETNFIFLEQVEELAQKTWQKSLERTGSWAVSPMPAPLVLATFNPAQNWVKDTFYIPWQEGKLPESVFYMNALPADNPYVSDEQREIWKHMAPEAYRRFVEGDWSAFAAERPFAYAFNPELHIKEGLQAEPGPIWLSFDFNVDPITCIAGCCTEKRAGQAERRAERCVGCLKPAAPIVPLPPYAETALHSPARARGTPLPRGTPV